MNSIRKKLLRWLFIGQLLAVVLTGSISFFYVRSELEDLFDDRLRQLAYSVPITEEVRPSPLELNNTFEDDDDFIIQVWQEDGQLLLHLNDKEGSPKQAEDGFSTYFSKNMLWRSFALHRGHYQVQVSQPFSDRLEMSLNIAFGAIAPILLLILFLGLLVWVAIGKGLRPLGALTEAVNQRNPHSLEPLYIEEIPVEILPLVEALNRLLQRLDRALEGQRKFIADAAHELRTPLTAVQLQAQLLDRCHDDAERGATLEQLRGGILRASHLVQQLLTLARMEPDNCQRPFSDVDLSALAKSVISDQTPAALNKNIDMGIGHDEAVILQGDSESLRVMLNNLLDNAIRYSQPKGQVDISLWADTNLARIEIEDNGSGIPALEREQVFTRFYRQPGTQELGSGLGLAIVQEIVSHHQGTIQLEDAKQHSGLKVTITLPLKAPGNHLEDR